MKTTWWALGLTLLFAPSAMAQTADDLANGAADTGNVLNYGMGYSLQRFSPLTQINKDTVKRLVPVWNYSFDDNKSEQSAADRLQGRDLCHHRTPPRWRSTPRPASRSGNPRSSIPPETLRVACCGLINRGVALYDGKLFRTTLDANVIALDAKTGKELWRANAIDFKNGYSMTVAPLVADGVVITGISGGEFGTRDFIDGWDAQTGQASVAHVYRARSWRARQRDLARRQLETWRRIGLAHRLVRSRTAHRLLGHQAIPDRWNAADRAGRQSLHLLGSGARFRRPARSNGTTSSSPNDPFDYDAVAEMVLATIDVKGVPTKVADAGKQQRLPVCARSHHRKARSPPIPL